MESRQARLKPKPPPDPSGRHQDSAIAPALAPYQPYFIAATLACLGYGYWLVYRRQKIACAEGEVCARPLLNYLVKTGLVLATVLVPGAIGLDLIGLYLFNP
jgi:mercuric ion transport protein